MSFGSDTEGGSPEGIGGNESDIGGSSGGSEGASYSQEAMNSALAASTQQMIDNNTEYGLAYSGMDASGIGEAMQNYTGGLPDAANTIATRNQINNFKDQSKGTQLGMFNTAGEVGQDRGFMGQALGEMGIESGLNKVGGITGGALGMALGGPIAGLVGSQVLGRTGTMAMNLADKQAINQAFGLVDRVTGPNPGALSKEQTDGLIKRLMDRRA